MDYESLIGSRFTFIHKGILIITQGCIEVSEQGLWIGLIDQLVGLVGLINNWARLSDLSPCGLKSLKPS